MKRRDEHGWDFGWRRGDWWLSIARSHMSDAIWLDVGKVRIRWSGPRYRPLFSERYGYEKWHKLGRVAVNVKKSRKPKTGTATVALNIDTAGFARGMAKASASVSRLGDSFRWQAFLMQQRQEAHRDFAAIAEEAWARYGWERPRSHRNDPLAALRGLGGVVGHSAGNDSEGER